MPKKRTGLPSLAYMGVEASTPPQMVAYDRSPTVNDYYNFNVGTLWINKATDPEELWILANKRDHIATWLQFSVGGGTINRVNGGDNINTVNPTGPTVTVNLNKSIYQPVTNASGNEGGYFLGGNTFLHGRGTQNTFVGESAGNLGLATANARRNTGIGFQALRDNINGENNTAVGESALAVLNGGDRNVAVGHGSMDQATDVDYNVAVGGDTLTQLLTGDTNIAIGYRAGFNYTSTESGNILIGNEGTVGEDLTIRIGIQGTQVAAYMAGIYGTAPGATNRVVFVDDTGKLGSSNGANGQILIGGGTAPTWANLVSGDGSITIANGPGTIDIRAIGGGGGGGATTFITDINSPAVIDGSNITMAGEGVLQTDGGSGSHVVTFRITNGTDGQLLIAGGTGPVWRNLTSAGGSVTITNGPNSINLEASGAGGGANTFHTDSGDANSVAGEITVGGGDNINTSGAASTVTVNLNKSILQPNTNATGLEGLYSLGGNRFLHNYGAAGTSYNTFLGESAGNLTLTTAVDNTGLGYNALNSLTTGFSNTCIGSDAGKDITTGSTNVSLGVESLFQINAAIGNTAVGWSSFRGIVTGTENIGLGRQAGANCTANDSYNILIGNDGVAGLNNTIKIGNALDHNTAYMAGIYGVTPAGATQTVIIDANGQLGSGTGGVGTITQVNGGDNINTVNPTGPVVTVNLDTSVWQPTTNASGTQGVYGLGGASFLHNYSSGGFSAYNTFVGTNAGNFSNSGAGNTAVGGGYTYHTYYDTGGPLRTLTSGDFNIAIGSEALYTVTTGDANVGIGNHSVVGNPTGTVGVGFGAVGFDGTSSGGTPGSYNVALGYLALASTKTAYCNNNVVIGNQAGNGVGNNSSCVIIGSGAGTPVTGWWNSVSSYNIIIGSGSGSVGGLTPIGGSNILISNQGVGGEANTIRIGTEGSGYSQQNKTYIAGIYNKTLGTPNLPVYVDSTGKLGTLNTAPAAFLYMQYGTVNNVTGDGSVYYLGSGGSIALTKIFDKTNSVYPGNGAGTAAYFSAPVTGLYFLEVQFCVSGLIAPPPPATPVNSDPNIITPSRTYSLINSVWEYQTNGRQSYFYNAICDMTAGDHALFSIDINFDGTKTLDIYTAQTFICGHLVSA